jgi:hypothetical protein
MGSLNESVNECKGDRKSTREKNWQTSPNIGILLRVDAGTEVCTFMCIFEATNVKTAAACLFFLLQLPIRP